MIKNSNSRGGNQPQKCSHDGFRLRESTPGDSRKSPAWRQRIKNYRLWTREVSPQLYSFAFMSIWLPRNLAASSSFLNSGVRSWVSVEDVKFADPIPSTILNTARISLYTLILAFSVGYFPTSLSALVMAWLPVPVELYIYIYIYIGHVIYVVTSVFAEVSLL